MLEDEGIIISTATAVDIEKILANIDLENLKQFSDLKYLLSPLICRNKEDQEALHKIFGKLDAKAASFYKEHIKEPDRFEFVDTKPKTDTKTAVKENWDKIKSPWALRNIFLPVSAILAAILLVYLFWEKIFPPKKEIGKIGIVANPQQPIVHEPVNFTAVVDSSYNTRNSTVDWKFPDTAISNTLSVQKTFTDTFAVAATAYLKDLHGTIIDSSNFVLKALCEPTPSVAISEKEQTGTIQVANKSRREFSPVFTNAIAGEDGYKYKWYVDDSLISTEKVLRYNKPFNKINLVVGCHTIHCSRDSLVAQLESLPAVLLTVNGDNNQRIQPSYEWKNILMSLLFLVLLPCVISFIVYRIIYVVRNRTPEIKKIKPGTEGPYDIEFNDQRNAINTEQGIRKFADLLRKRQVSDAYKLNIRKTIRSTVVAGGIPMLAFSPQSKPVDILVFIDKENPDSLMVKLFEYLVAKLREHEVNIHVYEYLKEPLFLSNEKLNQHRIPLQKLASLYPDTTLFVFGEAQYFLYPLKGTMKSWVYQKLNNWQRKILVTPFTKEDWDKKEKLLGKSDFFVVPADLSSIEIIDKIISARIDISDQKKENIESPYTARFINLQDFETLKGYLGEGPLLQWVCALAVYPTIDWNLTLAIGQAIEDHYRATDPGFELVHYTNLLKIGRISWTRDGMINESLRVKMLSWLDKKIQAIARETLKAQLRLVEEKINDSSLAKSKFDVQKNLNDFLLDSYHNKNISKESNAFIKNLVETKQLDEGQDIYLNNGVNTPVNHPFKKGKEVGLKNYFKLKTSKEILNALGFALVSLVALVLSSFILLKNNSNYLNWSSIKPVDQNYIVNISGNKIYNEVTLDLYYEPTHQKWRRTSYRLANTTDTVRFDAVPLKDTLGYGLVQIAAADGKLIRRDSFKLNSTLYNIRINATDIRKIPVLIDFKEASSSVLIGSITDNLSSNFLVSARQTNFSDTVTTNVGYYFERNRKDAEDVAAVIGGVLNQVVGVRKMDSTSQVKTDTTAAAILVMINPSATCTQLAISALPKDLNEIWHGGPADGLLNINLSQKIIYYTVIDYSRSYAAYNIDEICLTKNGAYKIIVRNDNRYKIFFIRNFKKTSFDLAVCPNLVPTKAELQNKDESYCGRFNTMSLYYETSPSRIYLPVSGASLVPSEKIKLDRIADTLNRKTATGTLYSYTPSLYSAQNYIGQVNDPAIGRIFSGSAISYPSSRNSSPTNLNHISIRNADPFDRNYLLMSLSRSNAAAQNPRQTTSDTQRIKQPDIRQQNATPCSKTYTYLPDALKNPEDVCILDLSNAYDRSLPKGLSQLKNLKKLILGYISYPANNVEKLKAELPAGCEVVYYTKGILWIDDNPQNNQPLITDFNNAGIGVVTARDITEASIFLQDKRTFDLVITDLARDKETTAGLSTLKLLSDFKSRAPLIVYSSADDIKQHYDESQKLNAVLVTSSPAELRSRVEELLLNQKQSKY